MDNNKQLDINYGFDNGLASLRQGAKPLEESVLRETTVYAKLMLSKGTKFGTVTDRKQFFLSKEKKHIVAELFIIGSKNQIVYDKRVSVYVDINANLEVDDKNKMYYVQLVHPTRDDSQCKPLELPSI